MVTATVTTPTTNFYVKDKWLPEQVEGALSRFSPKTELGHIIKAAIDYLPTELALDLLDRISSTLICESRLDVKVLRGCQSHGIRHADHLFGCTQTIEDYGTVSRKLVTATGVLYIANNLAGTSSYLIANFNFHGIGTGTTSEAATDQILVTELTTEYNPNSTRATGVSRAAAASGNNATYTTVGTNTIDSGTPAVTEHGLFTQAATGAYSAPSNVMLDRSVFSAINLVGTSGDGIQTTYVITMNSGG